MSDAIFGRGGDARSALMRQDWVHIEKVTLDELVADDWQALNRQRALYMREQRAQQALDMLAVSAAAPSFGYLVNNFQHTVYRLRR